MLNKIHKKPVSDLAQSVKKPSVSGEEAKEVENIVRDIKKDVSDISVGDKKHLTSLARSEVMNAQF